MSRVPRLIAEPGDHAGQKQGVRDWEPELNAKWLVGTHLLLKVPFSDNGVKPLARERRIQSEDARRLAGPSPVSAGEGTAVDRNRWQRQPDYLARAGRASQSLHRLVRQVLIQLCGPQLIELTRSDQVPAHVKAELALGDVAGPCLVSMGFGQLQ